MARNTRITTPSLPQNAHPFPSIFHQEKGVCMARVASPSLSQKRKTCVCLGEGSLASPFPLFHFTEGKGYIWKCGGGGSEPSSQPTSTAPPCKPCGLQLLGVLRDLLVLCGLRCFVQATPDLAPALRLEHDGHSVLLPDEGGGMLS